MRYQLRCSRTRNMGCCFVNLTRVLPIIVALTPRNDSFECKRQNLDPCTPEILTYWLSLWILSLEAWLKSLSSTYRPSRFFAMYSFFKIFYILVSTTALWITFTPPNLPPDKGEGVESTVLEVLFRQCSLLLLTKVSYQDAEATNLLIYLLRAFAFALLLLKQQSSLLYMYLTNLTPAWCCRISFFPVGLRNTSAPRSYLSLEHSW